MPLLDPDPEDPQALVGVAVAADRAATVEMAATFAEEFAALGLDEERLLRLFREPFYAGAHRAYRLLGEAAIRRIVRAGVERWGPCRVTVRMPAGGPGAVARRGDGREEDPCRR